MAAANCTAYAIYGQAFRCHIELLDCTTGLPIAGLTTGNTTVVISKDDAASGAPAGSFSVSGMAGVIYVDLTAADMTADSILVYASSTQPNAFAPVLEIVPLRIGTVAGAAVDKTIVLFEQVVMDIMACCINAQFFNGGTAVVYERDGVTPKFSGSFNASDGNSTRSNLT